MIGQLKRSDGGEVKISDKSEASAVESSTPEYKIYYREETTADNQSCIKDFVVRIEVPSLVCNLKE